MSPTMGHKDYNRFKYYSMLKTGFEHMDPNGNGRKSFLAVPHHVIDENLFVPNFHFGGIRSLWKLFILYRCWRVGTPWFYDYNLLSVERDGGQWDGDDPLGLLGIRNYPWSHLNFHCISGLHLYLLPLYQSWWKWYWLHWDAQEILRKERMAFWYDHLHR